MEMRSWAIYNSRYILYGIRQYSGEYTLLIHILIAPIMARVHVSELFLSFKHPRRRSEGNSRRDDDRWS